MTSREAVAGTADLRRADLPGVNGRCTLFTLKSDAPPAACNEPMALTSNDHGRIVAAMTNRIMPAPKRKAKKPPQPDTWYPLGDVAAAILRRLVRGEITPP